VISHWGLVRHYTCLSMKGRHSGFSSLKNRPEFEFTVRDSLCLCLIIYNYTRACTHTHARTHTYTHTYTHTQFHVYARALKGRECVRYICVGELVGERYVCLSVSPSVIFYVVAINVILLILLQITEMGSTIRTSNSNCNRSRL